MSGLDLFKENFSQAKGRLFKIWALFCSNIFLALICFVSCLIFAGSLIFLPFSLSPVFTVKLFTEQFGNFSSLQVFTGFFAVFFIVYLAQIFFAYAMTNWLSEAKFSLKNVFGKIPTGKSIFYSLVLSFFLSLFSLIFINSTASGMFPLAISVIMILFIVPFVTAVLFIALPLSPENNIINSYKKTKSFYEEKIPLEFIKVFKILYFTFFIFSLVIISLLCIDVSRGAFMFIIISSLLMVFILTLFIFPVAIFTLSNSHISMDPSLSVKKRKLPVYLVLPLLCLIGFALFYILDSYNSAKIAGMEARFTPELEKAKELNKFTRPVLRGTAIQGNAADIYLKLLAPVKNEKTKIEAKEVEPLITDKKTIKPVPEIYGKYENEINEIRKATNYQYVKFPVELSYNAPLPNFMTAQNLGKLMSSKMVAKYLSESPGEGIELLLDTIRYAQDFASSGSLIAVMGGVSIIKTSVNSFSENLNKSKTKLAFSKYQDYLKQIENLINNNINAKTGFILENAVMKSEFLKIGAHKSDINLIGEGEGMGATSRNFYQVVLLKPEIIDALEKLPVFDNSISDFDKPYFQAKKSMDLQNENLLKVTQDNLLLSFIIPNYSKIIERVCNNDAKVKGLYLMTALKAYQSQNNQYPEKLNALVPEIIHTIPVDPFTGKDFIYKRVDADNFVLYSPGMDLKDNNASNNDDLIIHPVTGELKL
jgi:hypothetical protein